MADILQRKETHFVLWRPRQTSPAPKLIIGKFHPGNPTSLSEQQSFDLQASSLGQDLWEIEASLCNLADGGVYHYWFEVNDSNPYKSTHRRILCTDPTAWTVDWRLLAPKLSTPYTEDDRDPAGVVKYHNGRLAACDPGGETTDWQGDTGLEDLPANNQLVIYELPTAWARMSVGADVETEVGTFRDVLALIEPAAGGANFSGTDILEPGRSHLKNLGVNALELLPPADSYVKREWGYATSNYFAADFDLGFPEGHSWPTASADLAKLIKTCHKQGMRFFADVVMAFATRYSYQNVNFLDFHVQASTGDPEELNQGVARDAFGGDLFKYNFWTSGYDPLSGQVRDVVPARRLMITYLTRWMMDFRIDGIRIDSVSNIANWDFVEEFKNHARTLWHRRWDASNPPSRADERFLVVGEELSVPIALLTQNRLDGLWNEHFKRLVRFAILGQKEQNEPSFESMIRKLIDCRLLGFSDGAQAVNYVTSHDVGEFRSERLFNFLNNNDVFDTERRIKLAFACLLTAVGVPMILAGEEFADQHDLGTGHPEKQKDAVNFGRMEDGWRKRVFEYVSRLVKLRTSSGALALNNTEFIHSDFSDGKCVVVWQRGREDTGELVVVVANFSDWGSDVSQPGVEYVVDNWPQAPAGKSWREITQQRDVPQQWAGREPIYPWEAKVYALV
jgi:pullulanase